MTVERVMSGAVQAALTRAADATGVEFSLLAETARRESGFNAKAAAPTSSARGMFQFIESTWLEMIARHGAEHGRANEAAAIDTSSGRARVADPQTRQAILALRDDPELSARMAGELARDNAAHLERGLGRAATPSELYAAHVLGPGGAVKLIRAAGDGAPNAAAMFPQAAEANRWLFFDRAGAPRSAAGLLERLSIVAAGEGVGAAKPGEAASPMPSATPEPAASSELWRAILDLGLSANRSEAADRPAPEIALLRAAAYRRMLGG